MSNDAPLLTKERMLAAFGELDRRLKEIGVTGELCVFGGATMILAFDARESTRDVDAIFVPKTEIHREAEIIAYDMELPVSWLNDGVKGFISEKGELTDDDMPQSENLRILRPSTRYLLAMKCMASQVTDYDGTGDRHDIIHLCQNLKITKLEEVLDLIEDYYPVARIPVKTKFFIIELIEEMEGGLS
jgi:hypothetical protein